MEFGRAAGGRARRPRPTRGVPPGLVAACVWVLVSIGCVEGRVRPLDELSIVDSTYVEPDTGEPYTGRVERRFEEDRELVQLSGTLVDGVWEGELIVYHPNGRVRYMGSFSDGRRCGAWLENADSIRTESAYDALVREVESMGLYPPCDTS